MNRRTDTIIKAGCFALLVPLALVACGHPHGTDAEPHEERAALVYTHYTGATELFVEFPALVVGESSTFAAHVTRLSDHEPLTSGTLDVLLESEGKTVARFRVRAPARTGIFTPAVTPRDAGTFDLAIEVVDGGLQSRHELGPVTVFPDFDVVEVSQLEREGDIAYLKEQQWTNRFAVTVAGALPIRPSVPGFATVHAPADSGAEIRAPSDGYFAASDIVGARERVQAGQVLGYLVPLLGTGSDAGSLLVDFERAQSQMTLAAQDVDRLQSLFEQGAVAERRLIEAQQAREVARAELRAARARVEQTQIGNAEAGIALRAPVAGEVVEVNARPGAFVRAGERVFLVAAPERRWLEVRVPERFAMSLRDASGAWFDRDETTIVVLDGSSGARVVQTSTAIDPVTRTASVTVEYPSARGPDLIGARFAAHIFTAQPEPRLAIPRSAVIDDGGQSVVYVQTGGEMFVRRPVELGLIDGAFVEVLSGIVENERVVSEGAYYVKLAATGGEEIGHGHAH